MLRNQIRSLLILAALSTFASAQCPWQRESVELQSACLCSYNLGHDLSVQCDIVEWPKLLEALNKHAINTRLDLLYVNNSTVGSLDDNVFSNLKIKNIQLSGCKIKSVSKEAFKGQEGHLKNLNLQDNELKEVPVESLIPLKTLSLLDLSHNKITSVPAGAFETLTKLATLKLSDNNVTLHNEALRGLEGCLKNLNLKGTRQREIPLAVRGMKTLAFLDLSQNSLRALPGKQGVEAMEDLNFLTALNLERNLIHEITKDAFRSVRKTLSSLSLLNNLLPDFPTEAMSTLKELRVLDIGFNLLTELPTDAFKGNPSITLLALDGNPLATIPFDSLSHLNNTLRGLSLGGRFLHCDCRLAWVVNWIRNGDLQVTSRERNPQFCGSPPRFRDRGFYSILPEELACPKKENEGVGVATVISAELDDVSVVDTVPTVTKTTSKQPTRRTSTSTTMKVAASTSTKASTTTKVTTTTTSKSTSTGTTQKAKTKSTTSPWKNTPRPPLVMGYPAKSRVDEDREVMVKNAFRQDNSVIIQWGSETANILGFRVVYRLFGDKTFKQGPPLEASEREFKIKNVPSQECIIVCVVSLETPSPTPESVPHSQCREVRTQQASASSMDKITIGASAAICGTIVVAVIVFVAAGRRRSKQLRDLRHAHKAAEGMKPPLVGGLPTVMGSCCGGGYGQSPGGGMSSLATLNAYNSAKQDWDQISGYSNHSIQRPRLYPLEQPSSLMTDDMRSHFSSKGNRPRSMADGQSQHSFSNHSGRYLTANAFPTNLLSSRQDLRQSRQSLAMQSDRLSARLQAPSQSVSSSRRSRPRSRSRDHHRPSSRYSTAGSTHTLNNYCGDTSDNNWTDHDMDIYMARAPTARNGMVPL